MATEQIKDQKKWNESVLKQGGNFMQSWEWGEFRIKTGISVFRIMHYESGTRNNYLQIEKRKLPLKKCYFYVAGARLEHKAYNLMLLLKNLKELAKKEKAIFLKWESLNKSGIKNQELRKIRFIKSNNIQPKDTLVLDIALPEQELLKGFHHKHRYNIRLAEKRGINVKKIETEEEFENFYKLIKKTDERKHTKSFSKKYYKELFTLSRNSRFKLTEDGSLLGLKVVFLGAYLKNILIAGLVLVVWNKDATYLIGASDYKYRKYMAPHLLQWEAIKLAKLLGAQKYDFWGVIKREGFENKKEFEHHRWAGITRFKMGFGGKITTYVSAYDYILSPIWYKMYRIAKKFT